jgi:hypothetical protein
MKSIFKLLVLLTLLLTQSAFAQSAKTMADDTMIGRYFKAYEDQPKYRITTMSEQMVAQSNEMGMWKHPSIARIMKQVKSYQYLNFDAPADFTATVIKKLDAAVKKDRLYQEYFKWETNGTVSALIYTRGKTAITEVVYITLSPKRMHISCYLGNNISMESIKALAKNE